MFARAAGAATQPEVATSSYVSLCTYIYVGMSEPICICKRAYIEYMSARMCVCVCACERASGAAQTRATTRLTYICVCVSTYVWVRVHIESMSA